MQVSAIANASTNSFPKLSFYAYMNPAWGVIIFIMHTGGRGGKVGEATWAGVPFWTKYLNEGQNKCIVKNAYFNRKDVVAAKEAEYAAATGRPGSDFWLSDDPDDPYKIDPKKFLVRLTFLTAAPSSSVHSQLLATKTGYHHEHPLQWHQMFDQLHSCA